MEKMLSITWVLISLLWLDEVSAKPTVLQMTQKLNRKVNGLEKAVANIEKMLEVISSQVSELIEDKDQLTDLLANISPGSGDQPDIDKDDSGLDRPTKRLVLRDDFNSLNLDNWDYEVSMYGGYNWEIQVYTRDVKNIFTTDGSLFIKPTLTADSYGEQYLHTGTMNVTEMWGTCTNAADYGCVRHGQNGLLPPVMSGKLMSKKTVTFGEVCVRARIPQGDWIWPAIWMLPRSNYYGEWPRSGEIDLMESRGNSEAKDTDGNDHGRNEIGSTLHWGPDAGQNKFYLTHGERDDGTFSTEMHTYCVDWTEDNITISVDGNQVMATGGNFWQKGGFSGSNIWSSGGNMAPFDQPFYLILNVAIAGKNGFFPDNWTYNSPKPWNNTSPTVPADFWSARDKWHPSWQGDNVAMEIDYVEMYEYVYN
ncbi:beta-1,3-glucan-binding protein-like [Mya arenaria]|uniref:beta-1,3-glucan-binding protein-like n=1 Tax=Mya arenaria TaxID=6604 RepID=UPI0022E483F5|nr:beta-1,3-glucan-binding protein-like [Mya arenaria]